MLSILTLTAALLAALILWIMVRGYLKGEHELISWRNFFLLGFLQFYAIAVVIMAPLEFPSEVYHPQGPGYPLLAMAMPFFLVLFLLGNRLARNWNWPNRIFPRIDLPVTNLGLLICVGTLAGLVVLSIGVTGRGLQEGVIFYVRPGMAIVASSLAFYLVLAQPRNPFYWGLFAAVFLLALVCATVGTIDRRNFLGVFFAIPWMWYYSRLRYLPPKRTFMRIAFAAGATFLCLVVYNSGRHAYGWQGGFKERANQFVELAQNPDFSRRNILQELLFQDTPLNTLAILENYPGQFPYHPLHGLHYYLVNPIPRVFYPDKPEALGIILQRQLSVQGANLGPGIIGHGWSEASWLGIAYYAVGFGALTAIADRLARLRGHNPYFLAALGGSLGNVLGLARGETSLFMVMLTVTFIVGVSVMWFLGIAMRPYMRAGKNIQLLPPDEPASADDFAEQSPHFADDLLPAGHHTEAA